MFGDVRVGMFEVMNFGSTFSPISVEILETTNRASPSGNLVIGRGLPHPLFPDKPPLNPGSGSCSRPRHMRPGES